MYYQVEAFYWLSVHRGNSGKKFARKRPVNLLVPAGLPGDGYLKAVSKEDDLTLIAAAKGQ